MGARGAPIWLPKDFLKREIKVFFRGRGPGRVPECHSGAFSIDFEAIL